MKEIKPLTKEKFDQLVKIVDDYNNERYHYRHIDYSDVLYTYFNPGFILNDWDEGPNNDQYWDYENNQCSEYKFINETVEKLNN